MNDYAEKLRMLARWLDDHPRVLHSIDQYEYPRVDLYLHTDELDDNGMKEEFAELCKAMGPFEKQPSPGVLKAVVRHDDPDDRWDVDYVISVSLSGACAKVPKVDDDGMPVMRDIAPMTIPGRCEQEYEYKCPESWLSLA